MPRGIGRLPFLSRRGAAADRTPNYAVTIDAQADVDDAPVGPPVLLPAMIYRQVLVDQTEVTPVWARPRPRVEPEPAGPPAVTTAHAEPMPAEGTDAPSATKPTRRRKGTGSPGEPKAPSAPRSPRKPTPRRRGG